MDDEDVDGVAALLAGAKSTKAAASLGMTARTPAHPSRRGAHPTSGGARGEDSRDREGAKKEEGKEGDYFEDDDDDAEDAIHEHKLSPGVSKGDVWLAEMDPSTRRVMYVAE